MLIRLSLLLLKPLIGGLSGGGDSTDVLPRLPFFEAANNSGGDHDEKKQHDHDRHRLQM